MTRKFKQNEIPARPEKPKGPVTLGRTTFIDKIIKRAESQPLVGPRKVASRQPTSSIRAIESPYVAFAEVQRQIVEQDSQEIENSCPIVFLQEGKLASHTLLFINMHFSNLGMYRGLNLEMARLRILLYISIFDSQIRVG